MRTAAFFDLDKTILGTSSALVFTRPLYDQGLINRSDVVRSAYRQFIFTVGSADREQTEVMRKYLSELVTGWDIDQLRQVVLDSINDVITPTVHAEALDLFTQHHAAGESVVIVSASGSEIVKPVAQLLGADDVIATKLEVEHGRYTGRIHFYAYGQNKANAMRVYASQHNIDLAHSSAYSDSITDLPMLEAVGRPHVVNPDSELRSIAIERGWPVLSFEKPIAMRRPIIDDPEQRKQALIAAGIVAFLIAWWVRRRKREVA